MLFSLSQTKRSKMKRKQGPLTQEQTVVRDLSDRLVQAQRPILILDTIKWGPEIKAHFFKHKFKELPPINAQYYNQRPLNYDADKKVAEE